MTAAHTGEPAPATRPQRRPELDALRALVVVGLVFFHSALVFDERDDFYVKNEETTEATIIVAGFGVVWAMPMLFLIAGLGVWHSLRRRGTGGFVAERLRRLGVPLVFVVFTLLPLPQWLRLRSADPDYHESYLRFLPRFFDVHLEPSRFPFVVQGEHFETGHMWFVVLLLGFSLLLVPLIRWLPWAGAGRARDRLAVAVGRRGVVLLPAVLLAAVGALVGMEEGYGGWHRLAYLVFFLCGFVLAADRRFRAAIRRDAAVAAVLGVGLLLASLPGFLIAGEVAGSDPFTDLTGLAIGARALFGAAGWCWVVAILGLLDRRGPEPAGDPAPAPGRPAAGRVRRLYGYLAAAVLPLYILHQPIVVAVAYGVVGWQAPMVVKYLVIVTASLGLTVAAYDVLVRRTRVTRFLFGMREPAGRRASPGAPAQATGSNETSPVR